MQTMSIEEKAWGSFKASNAMNDLSVSLILTEWCWVLSILFGLGIKVKAKLQDPYLVFFYCLDPEAKNQRRIEIDY